MKIDEIQNMWEQDCSIDDNYLGEAATTTPKYHSKYIKLLIDAKLKLSKYNSDYNQLRKTKFRYYRGEMSRQELTDLQWDQWQGVKPLKNEMDEILTGDSELNNIQMKIEYLNSMIYLLESILGQIRSRDFQIKNGIEWKKFLAGM
jgi:Recombination, repair and ssDNA binding protein UvsY